MSVILIRHGRPEIDFKKWLSPKEFGGWIEDYNNALLKEEMLRPDILECVGSAKYIVCSNLTRSIESSKKLGFPKASEVKREFREMELPHLEVSYPKMPVNFWLGFFRIAWFLGYKGNVESFKQAKLRADHAANYLLELSESHGEVLFVGHGFMNKYIHKNLLKHGHKIHKKLGNRYWGCKIYSPI